MFFVNSEQELIKTQFFTKNCDVWSTFQDFIFDFMLNFWGFCPLNSTFRHLKGISTSHKSKMNTFSGSTNLWRLLGKYEPLHLLLWYYAGVWKCVEGPKIGQKSKNSHFLTLNQQKLNNKSLHWCFWYAARRNLAKTSFSPKIVVFEALFRILYRILG